MGEECIGRLSIFLVCPFFDEHGSEGIFILSEPFFILKELHSSSKVQILLSENLFNVFYELYLKTSILINKEVKMDQNWMNQAIALARLGSGHVNPNPKVGAVIVKDNRKIGEGYHQRFGEPHAEINAIRSATESCENATLYVTLEPCFHHGKTPPCVDEIIRKGFKRVVIGMVDPNPKVAGKSIEKLRSNGIEVTLNVLEAQCRELNPGFIKLVETQKPYVLLKSAMTLDGKIATKTGKSQWITCEASRNKVHELRQDFHAIMVGIGTVLSDDPMLNTRIYETPSHPIRIIVDSKGKLPLDSQIVKTARDYKTILVTTDQIEAKKRDALLRAAIKVEIVNQNNAKGCNQDKVCMDAMMKRLGELNICSILLEGGGTLNDSLLRSGNVDEVLFFIAPKIFGGEAAKSPVSGIGIENISEAIELVDLNYEMSGTDLCIKGKVVNHVHRAD